MSITKSKILHIIVELIIFILISIYFYKVCTDKTFNSFGFYLLLISLILCFIFNFSTYIGLKLVNYKVDKKIWLYLKTFAIVTSCPLEITYLDKRLLSLTIIGGFIIGLIIISCITLMVILVEMENEKRQVALENKTETLMPEYKQIP